MKKIEAITDLIIGMLFCLLLVDAGWTGVISTDNQNNRMPASYSSELDPTKVYGVHNRDGTTTMFVGGKIITYRSWIKLKWVNTSGTESEMNGREMWVLSGRWSNPDTYGQGGRWEAAGMTIEILDSDGKVTKTLEIEGNTILLPELYSLIYQKATGSKQQVVAGNGGYEVINTDNLPFWQRPAETILPQAQSTSVRQQTDDDVVVVSVPPTDKKPLDPAIEEWLNFYEGLKPGSFMRSDGWSGQKNPDGSGYIKGPNGELLEFGPGGELLRTVWPVRLTFPVDELIISDMSK